MTTIDRTESAESADLAANLAALVAASAAARQSYNAARSAENRPAAVR